MIHGHAPDGLVRVIPSRPALLTAAAFEAVGLGQKPCGRMLSYQGRSTPNLPGNQ